MSKKTWMLAAMVGMFAASNDMYGAPVFPDNRPRDDKRSNAEKKKCKSCKHFCKGENGRCRCKNGVRISVYPMAVACGNIRNEISRM